MQKLSLINGRYITLYELFNPSIHLFIPALNLEIVMVKLDLNRRKVQSVMLDIFEFK